MGTFIILSAAAGTTTAKWPSRIDERLVGQLKCAAPNFWATEKQILARGPDSERPLWPRLVSFGASEDEEEEEWRKRRREGVNERKGLGPKIHSRVCLMG